MHYRWFSFLPPFTLRLFSLFLPVFLIKHFLPLFHFRRSWGVGLGVLAFFWFFLFFNFNMLQPLDWRLSDLWSRWEMGTHPAPSVVIVDVDEASLTAFGSWPWSRDVMAQLVTNVAADHPRSIGIDMVFPESKGDGDEALALAVSNAPVCLAVALDYNQQNRAIFKGDIPFLWQMAPPSPAVGANGFIGNYATLSEAARCVGHISPWVEADGRVRRVPLWASVEGHLLPTLSLAMGLRFGEEALRTQLRDTSATLPMMRIPFRVALTDWTVVPASEVLYGLLPAGFFEGKWVLVGSSAMGLSDHVATAVHPWLPGVVVHAELLSALLTERPKPIPYFETFSFVFAAMGGGLLVVLVGLKRLRWAVVTLVGLSVVWFGLAWWAWRCQSSFSLSFPWVLWWGTFLWLGAWHWFGLMRRHQHLTQLFKGYLAPELVESLLASPEGVLKPQRREVTVLYADIEGFTEMSRQLETEQVALLVQRVLEALTSCALQFEGTVDKYMGDEIMVFWNAPLNQPDHAERAVRCALEMLSAVAALNTMETQWPRLSLRIGIGTGEVLVGELGTQFRRAYTVVGYAANEAHKLTALGKTLQKRIVVNAACFEVLPDTLQGEAMLGQSLPPSSSSGIIRPSFALRKDEIK